MDAAHLCPHGIPCNLLIFHACKFCETARVKRAARLSVRVAIIDSTGGARSRSPIEECPDNDNCGYLESL